MAFRWRSWPEEGDKVSCCSWVTLRKFPFSLLEWCLSIEDDRRFDRCNMLWTVVSENSFVLDFPSRVVHLGMLICILFAFHLLWRSLPSRFPSTSLFRPFACMSLTQMGRQVLEQKPLPNLPPAPLFFLKMEITSCIVFSLLSEKKKKKLLRRRQKNSDTSEAMTDKLKP